MLLVWRLIIRTNRRLRTDNRGVPYDLKDDGLPCREEETSLYHNSCKEQVVNKDRRWRMFLMLEGVRLAFLFAVLQVDGTV